MIKVVYIITEEAKNNKTTYRIIQEETGKIRDVDENYIKQYNLDISNAKHIRINSLDTFSGRHIEGINDFRTFCCLRDDFTLLSEYDTTKNEKSVTEISAKAIDKVWWKCAKCGHEWQTNIKSRTQLGSGCPMCKHKAGKYGILVEGDNDLETYCNEHGRTDLLQEFSKDNTFKPSEITARSSTKKVIWECSRCGNKWITPPANRTGRNTGCPKCATNGTSFPEMLIYDYMSKFDNSVQYRAKLLQGLEADIFLPKYNTIIDYRGMYWHTDSARVDYDNFKESQFQTAGYKQIIILANYDYKNEVKGNRISFDTKDYKGLLQTILNMLGINENVTDKDVRTTEENVLENKNSKEVIDSVAELYPEVAKRWDYEKNGNFKPNQVTPGCKYKAWFICNKCGRSYRAFIRKQVNGQGCSYCDGTYTYKGINDVATTHPGILNIWDWKYNNKNSITPYEIKAGSAKKVRITCPYCDGKKDIRLNSLTDKNRTKCNICKSMIEV